MTDQIKELARKYPDCVFIKVTTHSKRIQLTKYKFIVPYDLSFGRFLNEIRHKKNMDILPEQTIIGLICDHMPKMTDTMGELYYKYKNDDGLLYISVETESVFG
jgi:hypothetical protein